METIEKKFNEELILKDLVEKSKKHYQKEIFRFFSFVLVVGSVLSLAFYFTFLFLLGKTSSWEIITPLLGNLIVSIFLSIYYKLSTKNKLLAIRYNIKLKEGGISKLKMEVGDLENAKEWICFVLSLEKGTVESYEICK